MAKEIGKVTHWFDKIGVAVIKLKMGLKKGDTIKIVQGEKEFEDTIASMQIEHEDVASGKKGDEVAVKLSDKARSGAKVFKV